MSIREDAVYDFGIDFARFMPLNDDGTIPVPDRIIGGIGPFDFSGVDNIAAVPLTVKFDAEDPQTVNVDLSGVVDQTAVTAEELENAINAAGLTDVLADVDTVTGRIRIEYDGTDAPDYMQVYGECAIIALIGQGLGCRFRKTDTLKSISDTPSNKDEETITTTDAKGKDTEVITDGYRKGFVEDYVDTAADWDLIEMIEGGERTPPATGVNETYELPVQDSRKPYFYVEMFHPIYSEGTNKEADLIGYVKVFHRSCKGSIGDRTHERAFADVNFTIRGTAYKDENDEVYPDTQLTKLSVEEYEELAVYDV